MGIKGLMKLIADQAPQAIKEMDIKACFGRKVAIDASMSLYQFLIAVRAGPENQVRVLYFCFKTVCEFDVVNVGVIVRSILKGSVIYKHYILFISISVISFVLLWFSHLLCFLRCPLCESFSTLELD